jgi:AraC-like DNA-binding protein
MDNFFKYLTPGKEDKSWGLYLNVAGTSVSPPNARYPIIEHPSGYYFTWAKGRILQEYQINYISDGYGIFETDHGKYQIEPGNLLIIRPGVKHRYKPLAKTGWHENYIGFNGNMAHHLLNNEWFNAQDPVIHCGYREELIDTYLKIFDLVKEEKPGYQQIASGLIIKLLGYLISFEKQKEFSGKRIAGIIEEARFKMREKVDQVLDMEKFAGDYHIGYSYFRKMFKSYTGVAPHQYHLELKIMRAKELLLSTDKSIKEISFELGFQSIHYFSRIFKSKTGVNPTEFRR